MYEYFHKTNNYLLKLIKKQNCKNESLESLQVYLAKSEQVILKVFVFNKLLILISFDFQRTFYILVFIFKMYGFWLLLFLTKLCSHTGIFKYVKKKHGKDIFTIVKSFEFGQTILLLKHAKKSI